MLFGRRQELSAAGVPFGVYGLDVFDPDIEEAADPVGIAWRLQGDRGLVTDAEANTKEQIQKARSHPWISPEVPVRGFVYDVSTGRLSEVFPAEETVSG